MRRLLILAAALLLSACDGREPIKAAPKAGDVYRVAEFDWHVVSERELRQLYTDNDMPLKDGEQIQGFIGNQGGRVVIYTTPPKRVDDAATTTLGHEVMHAALGNYHQ